MLGNRVSLALNLLRVLEELYTRVRPVPTHRRRLSTRRTSSHRPPAPALSVYGLGSSNGLIECLEWLECLELLEWLEQLECLEWFACLA